MKRGVMLSMCAGAAWLALWSVNQHLINTTRVDLSRDEVNAMALLQLDQCTTANGAEGERKTSQGTLPLLIADSILSGNL